MRCYFSIQLEDSEQLSECQSAAMAALGVIGGVDTRPRLGGLVRHEEWGIGTLARIMPNGKVTVQFHEASQARIVRLADITSVCSILSNVPSCKEYTLSPLHFLY